MCINMGEYDLIMMNMLEYACIYLNKQSSEYVKILDVFDAVHSICSLYKLLNSYQDRGVLRTLSNIWDGTFCKKNNAWVQVCNQKFFREWKVLWSFIQGTLINILSKTKGKKASQENVLEFFNPRINIISAFFPESG